MKVANMMVIATVLLGLSTGASAVVLVGGDTLNGNFNSLISESTVDAQPFSNTVAWVNLSPSGNQNTQATRANLDYDGSRNVVMSGGDAKMFGLDTGHTISAGEVYDVGYVWRDASAWVDASTEVQVTLFVTDDGTINGTRTDLIVDLSGLSTQDSTYEEVDHDGIYTATAADAGKTLFVVFRTTAASGGFGRFDNFTLEASATVTASGPTPEGAAEDVLVDTVLSWAPGMSATAHDVYFGTSFEDVNAATVPTSAGQDANSFDPGHLAFGTTYFWRVDEIEGANTVLKGYVWSFTAEPYAIMIPVDVNDVTASSSSPLNPPSMIVNGAGLDGTTHSVDAETMWRSSSPDAAPWLMFEFDNIQKLEQMQIWNSNSISEIAVGWGIKDVNIEYSADGENWTALGQATQISQAPGLETYSTPHAVDLGLAVAKYVKINILNNWGGLLSQYGVAEVQFYGMPVYARTPDPVPGTVILPSTIATWRAGREAATHTIIVSADPNALADGTAPSVSLTTNSVDLSSLDLQLDQQYYWRVDEVNEAEAQSAWQGPVWTLSTVPYLTIDNFDGFDNVSPNRPFQTWLDGFGYSADEFFPAGYEGNGTGSGVGHDIWSLSSPHYDGQIMESTVAKSGKSMPLYFNNTNGLAVSETEVTFDSAQDWTAHDIKSLSLN
ncbi:MAG: discoidin domain-containing protein, partial [Planctomycetes bacterium]|nr:discoidin domain-containing protein [Planctomycetota bacterium]